MEPTSRDAADVWFHLPTLMLSIALVALASAASLAVLRSAHPHEPAVPILAWGLVFQAASGIARLLVPAPLPLSIALLSQTFLLAGISLQWAAFRSHFRGRVPWRRLILVGAGFLLFFAGAAIVKDIAGTSALHTRLVLGSGSVAIVLELARERREETMPGPRRLCLAAYGVQSIATAGWFFHLWLYSPSSPWGVFLAEGALQTSGLLVAVLPSFGFALMLGQGVLSRQRQLAHTDQLTGLSNRRGFMEQIQQAFLRSQNNGDPMGLLVLDLDHFKAINDAHGHAVGDAALKAFAQRVQGSLRESDVAGRIGGEEFAVMLRMATFMDAMMVAERIRLATAATPVVTPREQVVITVSIGVACTTEGVGDLEALFRLADRRLYQAKREGRNRAVGFGLETHLGQTPIGMSTHRLAPELQESEHIDSKMPTPAEDPSQV